MSNRDWVLEACLSESSQREVSTKETLDRLYRALSSRSVSPVSPPSALAAVAIQERAVTREVIQTYLAEARETAKANLPDEKTRTAVSEATAALSKPDTATGGPFSFTRLLGIVRTDPGTRYRDEIMAKFAGGIDIKTATGLQLVQLSKQIREAIQEVQTAIQARRNRIQVLQDTNPRRTIDDILPVDVEAKIADIEIEIRKLTADLQQLNIYLAIVVERASVVLANVQEEVKPEDLTEAAQTLKELAPRTSVSFAMPIAREETPPVTRPLRITRPPPPPREPRLEAIDLQILEQESNRIILNQTTIVAEAADLQNFIDSAKIPEDSKLGQQIAERLIYLRRKWERAENQRNPDNPGDYDIKLGTMLYYRQQNQFETEARTVAAVQLYNKLEREFMQTDEGQLEESVRKMIEEGEAPSPPPEEETKEEEKAPIPAIDLSQIDEAVAILAASEEEEEEPIAVTPVEESPSPEEVPAPTEETTPPPPPEAQTEAPAEESPSPEEVPAPTEETTPPPVEEKAPKEIDLSFADLPGLEPPQALPEAQTEVPVAAAPARGLFETFLANFITRTPTAPKEETKAVEPVAAAVEETTPAPPEVEMSPTEQYILTVGRLEVLLGIPNPTESDLEEIKISVRDSIPTLARKLLPSFQLQNQLNPTPYHKFILDMANNLLSDKTTLEVKWRAVYALAGALNQTNTPFTTQTKEQIGDWYESQVPGAARLLNLYETRTKSRSPPPPPMREPGEIMDETFAELVALKSQPRTDANEKQAINLRSEWIKAYQREQKIPSPLSSEDRDEINELLDAQILSAPPVEAIDLSAVGPIEAVVAAPVAVPAVVTEAAVAPAVAAVAGTTDPLMDELDEILEAATPSPSV